MKDTPEFEQLNFKKTKKQIILQKFNLIEQYRKEGYSLNSILNGFKRNNPEFESIKYRYFVLTLTQYRKNPINLPEQSRLNTQSIDVSFNSETNVSETSGILPDSDDIQPSKSVWELPTEHKLSVELKNKENHELEFENYNKKMFGDEFLKKYNF